MPAIEINSKMKEKLIKAQLIAVPWSLWYELLTENFDNRFDAFVFRYRTKSLGCATSKIAEVAPVRVPFDIWNNSRFDNSLHFCWRASKSGRIILANKNLKLYRSSDHMLDFIQRKIIPKTAHNNNLIDILANIWELNRFSHCKKFCLIHCVVVVVVCR